LDPNKLKMIQLKAEGNNNYYVNLPAGSSGFAGEVLSLREGISLMGCFYP